MDENWDTSGRRPEQFAPDSRRVAETATTQAPILGWRVEHDVLGPAFTHHEVQADLWIKEGRKVTALAAPVQSTAAQQSEVRGVSAGSEVDAEQFLDKGLADVGDEGGILTYYSKDAVLECIRATIEHFSTAAPGETATTQAPSDVATPCAKCATPDMCKRLSCADAILIAQEAGEAPDLVARGMAWEECEAMMREACAQAGVAWGEDQKPQDIAINVMQRLANAAHKAGFKLALERIAATAAPGGMTAFDEARDAILNERGPLEGMGLSGDQINAVLAVLDDAASVPRYRFREWITANWPTLATEEWFTSDDGQAQLLAFNAGAASVQSTAASVTQGKNCAGAPGECDFNGSCMYSCKQSTAAGERVPSDSTLPPMSCSHSNRSYCALFGVEQSATTKTARPSKEWYAAKIQETLDDDFVIGADVSLAQPEAPEIRAWLVQFRIAQGWHDGGAFNTEFDAKTEAEKFVRGRVIPLIAAPQAEKGGEAS